jgi:DNA-directed RNA polymerase subunit RPC12/RpoP
MKVQSSGVCPDCGERRLIASRKPNHLLHLILTIITVGLWAVIWFFIAWSGEFHKWRCQNCGTQVQPS